MQTIARSAFGTDQLAKLDVGQLGLVHGILERRVRQLRPEGRAEAIFADAEAHAEKMTSKTSTGLQARQRSSYSTRNTTKGSTLPARRAGKRHARGQQPAG